MGISWPCYPRSSEENLYFDCCAACTKSKWQCQWHWVVYYYKYSFVIFQVLSLVHWKTEVQYFNDYPLFWWGESHVFDPFQSIGYEKNQIVDPRLVSDQRVKVREKAAAAAAAAFLWFRVWTKLDPKLGPPNPQEEVWTKLSKQRWLRVWIFRAWPKHRIIDQKQIWCQTKLARHSSHFWVSDG